MSRMRLGGLVLFTFFTIMMLSLAIASAVSSVSGKWDGRRVELLGTFVLLFAMLAGAVGLWSRWILRNVRDKNAGGRALLGVPHGKYAAWASRSDRRKSLPAHKTVRRKG